MMAFADSTCFIGDSDGQFIATPTTYDVTKTIKNLGESQYFESSSEQFLKNAEDIFIDQNDYIYVADTGNNRVIKLDREGQVQLVITEACDLELKEPKGVYVHSDNTIWIADTGNRRIVVLDENGNSIREYGKPESDVLGSSFTFDVEKIYVNNMGYIYALKGANIMRINSKNEFQGYMGAQDVGFSLYRYLIKTFGTKEMREKTTRVEPTAYNNFMIVDDGTIYGVLSDGDSGQIRRLNTTGDNTYPEQAFGYDIWEEGEYEPTTATFMDITVSEDGMVTVLDQGTGLIYQYDQEGNLLTTFGGLGSRAGKFSVPTSIAQDSDGNLYVLDFSANNITVFEPTQFVDLIHTAINYQKDGHYEDAKSYWEEVLAIDANYMVAHNGIGKILYKEEAYKDSMEDYKMGDYVSGYSNAFSEYRHNLFRKYFGLVVIFLIVLLVAVVKGFGYLKKKANKWTYNIEMKGDIDP
jgi:DNA-binding beta-propeller fold protein YncE